jgi:photosystem II stability/assembly factor-like uncharacterized protein
MMPLVRAMDERLFVFEEEETMQPSRFMVKLSILLTALLFTSELAVSQDLTWVDQNGVAGTGIKWFSIGPAGYAYASDDSGYVLTIEPDGMTWTRSFFGPTVSSNPASAVVAHPSGKVFAVSGQKVYATTDMGQSWTQITTMARIGRTMACTIQGSILIGASNAVYRSSNQGSSWSAVQLPAGATEPVFLPYDSVSNFAATPKGIFRGTGEGSSWQLSDTATQSIGAKSLARDSMGRIFAAADSGMYLSSDSGSHWARTSGVMTFSAVVCEGNVIVSAGAADGKIYRSTNAGTTWEWTGASLPSAARTLAYHSSWKLVAGTASGLYHSTNQGTTWSRLLAGLTGRPIVAIGENNSRMIAADRDSGLYYRKNIESAWFKSSSASPIGTVGCILGASWNSFFAGSLGAGVFHSKDGGATWLPTSSGLTNLDVSSLTCKSQDTLFAGTAGGVFRSLDSGATWTFEGSGLPGSQVRALAVYPGGGLMAGTFGGGIYRSTDNGVSWNSANAGLTNLNVTAIAVSKADDWVYVGTSSGGAFVSSNSGTTWGSAGSGLNDEEIRGLAVNSEGDVFAAGPTGVYRSKDHGVTWAIQNSGFPSASVNAVAVTIDDFVLAGTNGAGVYGALSVTPTAPPSAVVRWMGIGSLQNWFSSAGCEIEVGRSTSADQEDGWQWPAQYSRQDMQASKGLWIGTTGYHDGATLYPRKVVHLGPRSRGTGEFIPVSMTSIDRFPRARVTVQGVESLPPLTGTADSVSRNLSVDRMIQNTASTSIGITINRRILQTSQQWNDNYIIQEYTFTNTGNVDADQVIERPGVTLDSVYFYFLYRFGICADTRYVIGNATAWGMNTMIDTRGDGVMADPPGEQLRAQFVWHGRFPNVVSYDNIGGPIWIPYYDKADTVGRLGAAQFDGVLTLHADMSPGDTSDDSSQPSTTSWEDSDNSHFDSNSQYDATAMNSEFSYITRGHKSPRHAWQVEPTGNFSQPTVNPWLNTGGGFSAANAYGPYRLKFGESVRIVLAEASAGLSREKCVSVGNKFKHGLLSAKDKNDSVLTGKDSLFQTFHRARTAYAKGYSWSLPPNPPKTFSVTPQGSGFLLSWDVYDEPGPQAAGFRVYRATGKYDGDYTLLTQLSPDKRSFVDSSITRGLMYYYYLSAIGDSLESSRFYTQTYDFAWLQPLGVDETVSGVPTSYALEQNYPNPFNPTTTIRFTIAGVAALSGSEGPARMVKLVVYDLLGREITTLIDGQMEPGRHDVTFEGVKLASGVYVYRLNAGGFVQSRKMLLQR